MFALRPWMPWLKGKITQHIRCQIKQRAAIQNKEMVKHSVSKTTQKKTVPLDVMESMQYMCHSRTFLCYVDIDQFDP